MGLDYKEGTKPPGPGRSSFGTATPGTSPQAELKASFQGKQLNMMGKGEPRSIKAAQLSAVKRRIAKTGGGD